MHYRSIGMLRVVLYVDTLSVCALGHIEYNFDDV